jgi:outer membrane protein OmpA-like peptidoglycan-associated protein
MKWKLSGLAAVLALSMIDFYAPPADACGVKLAFKMQRPRKGAAKTAKPSNLLLVGTPPKRLEHDLAAAGHQVETVSSTSQAKRQSYEVVVVASNDQATEARTKFPDATIVVRSGDVTADVRSVEGQLGKRPVVASEQRPVVAAGPAQKPVAAKPVEDNRKVVGAKTAPTPTATAEPTAAAPPAPAPAPAPKPEPEKVATTQPTPEPTKPAKEVTTAPAKKTAGTLNQEVYFTIGSSTLQNKNTLDKSVQWLKSNPDVNASIEGHADPSGNADANMALSQARAEFVRDYLVAAGIDTARLEVKPMGDTKLKYGAKDARNRRVLVNASR